MTEPMFIYSITARGGKAWRCSKCGEEVCRVLGDPPDAEKKKFKDHIKECWDKPEAPMTEPTCETCRFFLNQPDNDIGVTADGVCRRYPRQFGLCDRETQFSYPPTDTNDWCGEYQSKEQAHAQNNR